MKPEPRRPGHQIEHAGHQREDGQQSQIPFRVASCERRQARSDQEAGGGVRTDDQLPRRAEERIGQEREDRRVDADDGRHACEVGVSEADGQGDRCDRDPGQHVFGQPAAVVPRQRGDPGHKARQPAARREARIFSHASPAPRTGVGSLLVSPDPIQPRLSAAVGHCAAIASDLRPERTSTDRRQPSRRPGARPVPCGG